MDEYTDTDIQILFFALDLAKERLFNVSDEFTEEETMSIEDLYESFERESRYRRLI